MGFRDNDEFPDELPGERLRFQGSRTFCFLLAISVLAIIQFEWFQLFLGYNGPSMLSRTFVNATSQTAKVPMYLTNDTRPAAHTSPRNRTETRNDVTWARNRTGTWIGNTWIPPTGWHYHTPAELRQFYGGKKMMWIGDSTGRRAAMNMYALLEWTNSSFLPADLSAPKLIDATKKAPHECNKWLEAYFRPHICRELNFTMEEGGRGELIYSKAVCLSEIELFFQKELDNQANITKHTDVIIVAVGIWDILKPFACRAGMKNRTLAEMISDVIELTNEFQISTGKTVVWRTSGYSEHRAILTKTSALNKVVMDKIDQVRVNNTLYKIANRFSYVDWGGAVISRSLPGERIQGDMKPHYGFEPRHVLIEMITNSLEDEGYLIHR